MTPEVLDRVRKTTREIVEFANLELVHFEIKRAPGGLLLRVYIDKEGGVTLDDCARVSRQLSVQLDVDRKSTRLNSSHVRISYAVFCLKKKNTSNADGGGQLQDNSHPPH